MDSNQNDQRSSQQQEQQAMDVPISFVPSVLHQLGLDREESHMSNVMNEQLAALHDSDWRVRVSVIRTLERWGSRVPSAVFVQALADEDSSVSAAAVHALGMLGEKAPQEPLLLALQDSDWHVRETAVLALGGLGAHISEKSLVLALKDSDSMVREAAQLVLHKRHNVTVSAVQPVESEKTSNAYEPQTSYSIIMDDAYPLEAHADRYSQFSRMEMLQRLEPRKVGFLRSHWGILTVCAVFLIVAANVSGWLLFSISWHSSAVGSVAVQAMPTTIPYVPVATPTVLPPPITSVLGRSVASIPVGQTVYTYHGQSAYISSIAWSPNGTRIASASADNSYANNSLEVWNAFTGQAVFNWRDPSQNAIVAVAWSPDNRYIAVGASDSQIAQVYVLNANNGEMLSIYSAEIVAPKASEAHIGALRALSGGGVPASVILAWSPDSGRIAAAIGDGIVRVFDATAGTIAGITEIPSDGNAHVSSIAWSPDGQYIAYGLASQLILWDITTKQPVVHTAKLSGNWVVTSIAWSRDEQNIALGLAQNDSGNVAAEIWSPFTGGDSMYMNRFVSTWSPDSVHIAGTDNGQNVQIWDASTGNVLFTYADKAGQVSSVAWSPDGNFIASNDGANEVNVWRAP